jgi:hypothetical protein
MGNSLRTTANDDVTVERPAAMEEWPYRMAFFMTNTLYRDIYTPTGQEQAAFYLKNPTLNKDDRKFLVAHVATVALSAFQNEPEAKALLANFFYYIRTESNLTVDLVQVIRDKVESFEFDTETYDEDLQEQLRENLLYELDDVIKFMKSPPLRRDPSELSLSKPARAEFLPD